MTRMPPISIDDLTMAYLAWPTADYDKATLRALVLRVRIEQCVAALPTTVIAAPPDSTRVPQRLMLSAGEPGLDADGQTRRLRIVMAAINVYCSICDLLHARTPDPNPPLQDVATWAAVVEDLENELIR